MEKSWYHYGNILHLFYVSRLSLPLGIILRNASTSVYSNSSKQQYIVVS